MMWFDYWNALSARQRIGLSLGVVLIVVLTLGLVAWLLHDPYVPMASKLSAEQLHELTVELDEARLDYRISDGADGVMVPQSQLGKARAAIAGRPFAGSTNVGLELFKES